MRISRKKRPELPSKTYFYNEGINFPEVLVLGNDGQRIGEMKTGEAVRFANEQEMDLVLINPKSTPPVVKVMNFGQFKYQKDKEDRQKKAHQHVVDTKVVRLSLRIGEHDLDIRKNQSIKFLKQGNKVKIELVLRGREMQQAQRAFEFIKEVMEQIASEEKIRVEEEPKRQTNKIFTTITKA